MAFVSRLSLPLSLIVFGAPVFAASAPGIKNFDQVDAHVYRGGQPTVQGFQYLSNLGVKTIIDLREAGSRASAEQHAVEAAGMRYINVPMGGFTPPTQAEMNHILSVLEDHTTGPVFVHCRRGADRTGAVIAAYHIDNDKWTNVRALADANDHHMSMFQVPRKQFIKSFHARPQEAKAPAITPAVLVPEASAARD